MQQLQYIDSGIIDDFKCIEDEAGYFPASSSSKNSGMMSLEDRMEKLLDILKEGQPQLSVVAILIALGWTRWLLLQRLTAAVM
ncbi:hypothetical protein AB3S75_019700 [Citrus x aurantiifolia]